MNYENNLTLSVHNSRLHSHVKLYDSQETRATEPQVLEQVAKIEELSSSFVPCLSEEDRVTVQEEVTRLTNSHRALKARLAEQAEALGTDIEEVNRYMRICDLHPEKVCMARSSMLFNVWSQ